MLLYGRIEPQQTLNNGYQITSSLLDQNEISCCESYARVFPLPVTASTTTSEFFMNMGMAACCTGVVFTKPMESTASSIHSDKAGVKAPKDRSVFVWGAMMHVTLVLMFSEAAGKSRRPYGKVARTLKF